jgi:DNA modification methylase
LTPYHSDPWLTVYQGDCRAVLASMAAESVHCVVTSPPYWGLRDYGTATWIGGDAECPHRVPATGSTMNKGNNNREGKPFDAVCGLCGAIRQDSQLGLEPTPELYVANMVDVFREVRRVLRADGTVWLNLGDSYAAGGTGGASDKSRLNGGKGVGPLEKIKAGPTIPRSAPDGLKPKDLVGIPWRVAFALQADGWYLRSDIIWSKPNPMPESVTDRPTKSHEYLFLLSKSARYYYDADAVREPHVRVWDPKTNGGSWSHPAPTGEHGKTGYEHRGDYPEPNPAGRNLRSVWTVATQPYPGAHFATFPEKLIEPCIKAGSSDRGVCPECGAPWVRVVETERVSGGAKWAPNPGNRAALGDVSASSVFRTGDRALVTTTGWRPSCGHGTMAEAITHSMRTEPAVILDPFAGSGTTGRVAQRLSRRAVLIDLNADYLVQAMGRNSDIPLGLEAS